MATHSSLESLRSRIHDPAASPPEVHDLRRLARSATPPDAAALIALLLDAQRPTRVRVQVARILPALGPAAVRESLRGAVRTEAPEVAAAAALALARVGEAGDAAALQALERSVEGKNASRVQLALRILEGRTGTQVTAPEHRGALVEIRGAIGEDLETFSVQGVAGPEAEQLRAFLRDHPVGFPSAHGLAVRCRHRRWVVALADEILEAPSRATRAPSVLACAARHDRESGEYAVDLWVLGRPMEGARVHLLVVTAGGRPVYAGEGHADGTALRFELRTLATTTLPPMVLEGTAGPRDVRVARALVTEPARGRPLSVVPR